MNGCVIIVSVLKHRRKIIISLAHAIAWVDD
jgi:hypothetical protein